MIDAQHEAADRLRHRLEGIHGRLADGVVILITGSRVAGTGGNCVDDDQSQR
jgi:hypothetical protein